MSTAQECPACAGRWPREEQRIVDLALSTAYLNEDQFFPGWTILVLKRHATELFQLSREERAQLIEEVTEVARALTRAFDTVKINYELLGNQVPHIHWHVVPRLADDPIPREPVWRLDHEPRRLPPPGLAERLARIRTCLGP